MAANNFVGAVGGFFLDVLGIDDGAASGSFSVDGLFGIPLAKNMSGKGVSVDVAVTASINWRDPLNFAVSVQDSVSVLDTIGMGGFVTTGPAVGSSTMPNQGFSESLYVTGRAAVGFGGAVSTSLDFFGNPQTGELTGSSGSAGGGLGFGLGALSGVTDPSSGMEVPSYSFSTGTLNGKAALEAYYKENCE
ncbi:hypothetical protein G0Q06_13085 [Puniceicoccales bacterium CK1056]|uniref:Uncharacterized protein n=1 Tax=Oceanipulchritudo coccoides TaxID=2706888 RepID=A0A6B2M3R4_9BACT|nr:hypothetical protein [Oceanipulchritudo coccoides]NDV63393.1 hypothetical protein [Oceanipulchritudo coccoides]